ncbi:MAG: hypothetical protein ACIWVG_32020 [Gloeotrichia echinulata HAB0833]
MKKFLHKHGTVIALTLAGFFHLISHLGTQFERYQICFAPSEKAVPGCEKDIDLVVLKQLYDLSLYAEGNSSEFKREWIDIIKKSTVVKNIPATNPDIPKYSLAVLGLIIYARYNQGLKVSTLQNNYSSELEAFSTKVYEDWVHGFNERKVIFKKQEFQAEREIALEINKLRGKGELTHLQEVLKRSNTINEAKFDLVLEEIAAKKSEFSKLKAENLRDAAKADKEMNKTLGKGNDIGNNTTAESKNKELINQLVNALKEHEEGWLWTVVDAIKPIWLVGDMGTGKTNTSVAIGLIRKYCLDIPVFRIADRHLNGENSEVWNLLEAQLKADNDLAILEAIQDAIERRDDRINSKVEEPEQFLLDEFTQLAKLDKESVERFVASTFSDTRKAKEYFIGVTHNLTNAAFGDGTAEMRKGAFYLQKFTLDNKKPLPRILIKTGLKDDLGNNLEDVEKTLPAWFRAETIFSHFNGKPINFED